jgi:hypothetical protein
MRIISETLYAYHYVTYTQTITTRDTRNKTNAQNNTSITHLL